MWAFTGDEMVKYASELAAEHQMSLEQFLSWQLEAEAAGKEALLQDVGAYISDCAKHA